MAKQSRRSARQHDTEVCAWQENVGFHRLARMPTNCQTLLAVLKMFKWLFAVASPFFLLIGIGVLGAGNTNGNATQTYVGYAIIAAALITGVAAYLSLANNWEKPD
jgi:hypothetical protein